MIHRKTILSKTALCFQTTTSLAELNQYVRVVAARLYREAIAHDLEITGPVYWVYAGADGQPETTFTLTIALPVSAGQSFPAHSEFALQTLEPFTCLSMEWPGAWDHLGAVYGALMGEIQSKGLAMTGINREIYLHMDFDNPAANITEVQVGILPPHH